MKIISVSLLMGCLAGSCLATSITWDNSFAPSPVNNGSDLGVKTKTFLSNVGGYSLTANSVLVTNMPNSIAIGSNFGAPTFSISNLNLAWKNQGGTLEHGLGVWDTVNDAEIRLGNGIRLDFSAFSLTSIAIVIDSIDINEGYRIWGSATATGYMTLLAQGAHTGTLNDIQVQTQTLTPGANKFFYLTSDTPVNSLSSVVLRSATINDVPEPATFAMIGAGLLALGFVRTRKATSR